MSFRNFLLNPLAKPFVFLLCIIPFGVLFYGAINNSLGTNPAEVLIDNTGIWALRFLCLALFITPFRVISNTPQLARYRRMIGLFVFFYATLHLFSYLWLDMGFDFLDISKDILDRPFIFAGFLCWLLLAPLAATSFNRAIKLVGAKNWINLHKLVYFIAPIAVLHFALMRAGKNDFYEVFVYAVIIFLLLFWRLVNLISKKISKAA